MCKARILVIEDEVIIAQDIQRTLIKLDYDVPIFVTSAESALELIGELRPDLVLMDIHLNDSMDGITAAEEIRRRDRQPVVFLTAHSDEATLTRAKITEPYGYVLKPFEERELQIAIDIALYRHKVELQLKQMERWLSTTLKSIGDGVIATDVNGAITFTNRVAEALTGWSQNEALGRPFTEVLRLVHVNTRAKADSLVERVLDDNLIIEMAPDTVLINRDGQDIPVDDSAAPIRDEDEKVIGVVIIFRDISARKCVEEKLRHLATHDALTGLPNRTLFSDRLAVAFELTKRRPNYCFAVLFIDLDRFKIINDSLGHLFGDKVLLAAAQRLGEDLRGEDTLARLGGDEFVILLSCIGDILGALHVANRILSKITEAILVDGQDVFTSASIGIALSGPRYERAEEILRDADAALYQAKAEGRGRFSVFDTALHERALRLLQLETDLRRTIERKEFRIYYQPIVSLANGCLNGFEALLRWQHPERGLLAPADFLALAEEMGLMTKITEWLLTESCQQLRAWQQQAPANTALTIAVNLSQTQFLHPLLRKQITRALASSGLEARCLCLEVSEDVIADQATAARILAELDELGVQLHLDDFGTGYSSFNMLQHSPIDVVKIDRSFVQPITDPASEKSAIVRAILSLTGELGKEVVAEGIETAEQAERLLAWGCRYGQGYHFAKPLTAAEAERFCAHSSTIRDQLTD
ncbi:EAL domain-containing protein [Methylomicrobium sp. Wu6]|uniref:putative bifunctional diguanylate cyclase/phosphodiesterase n=1 Tax=Methylomicrobium sp. Wu6 TaxID=3107928 RepID=UPI002DD643BA|nr:EAL domain-containing protein [Methylomicrobium sp. Wu6]MEC4749834.1 EAL domain-containing protein [Methylomicrobium sp. Wu6]